MATECLGSLSAAMKEMLYLRSASFTQIESSSNYVSWCIVIHISQNLPSEHLCFILSFTIACYFETICSFAIKTFNCQKTPLDLLILMAQVAGQLAQELPLLWTPFKITSFLGHYKMRNTPK